MNDEIESLISQKGEIWRQREVFQLYGWVRPMHFIMDDPDADEAQRDGESRKLEVHVFAQAGDTRAIATVYEVLDGPGSADTLSHKVVRHISGRDVEDALRHTLASIDMA